MQPSKSSVELRKIRDSISYLTSQGYKVQQVTEHAICDSCGRPYQKSVNATSLRDACSILCYDRLYKADNNNITMESRILAWLDGNGKATYKTIAQALGEPGNRVLTALRRLRKKKKVFSKQYLNLTHFDLYERQ